MWLCWTKELTEILSRVCLCRHRVVYRLVGGVYLMVVASAQANVLWLLGLMDACVRVLIGVARSVEVTPDKLARRYPEVTPLTEPGHLGAAIPETMWMMCRPPVPSEGAAAMLGEEMLPESLICTGGALLSCRMWR